MSPRHTYGVICIVCGGVCSVRRMSIDEASAALAVAVTSPQRLSALMNLIYAAQREAVRVRDSDWSSDRGVRS